MIESNHCDMVGAYHLHVEYDGRDHHEVVLTEIDSLDMLEESSLHAENNDQHLPQSSGMMTFFARIYTKGELGDSQLHESSSLVVPLQELESFSFEISNVVLAIDDNWENVINQHE